MAILRNDTTVRSADGQTTSSIITAANIGNYGISTTSTYYIGTTQNIFNRASGAQTLTGVSIDGNAANITAYTINQNVGTGNTPSFAGIVSSAITNYAFLQTTDTNNFWITPGNNNWGLYFETSAGGLLGGTGDSNRLGFVGAGSARFYVDLNNGNGWFGGSLTANTDSRAPIFYDSNDTTYYVDPAATSIVSNLTINNILTNGPIARNSYSVSVNTSTYWTITRPNGLAIANPYIYKISLVTLGTGTDTGEQYIIANIDTLGWVVKTVTKTGSGSNWPYVFLDAGVPKVKTDHPNLYTVQVVVEEFNTGNSGGLPTAFGLEGAFTSDNGTPKYRAGWFSSDNTLLHSGNYSGYSAFSGSVTSTYGSFASPGLIIGDAQYGFYVSGGNVYYKSASGGVHYWRNIANSANTMSLDNSGNILLSGYINASSYIYTATYLQTGGNLIYPSGYGATQRLEVSNSANNNWIDGITIAPGGIVTAPYEMRSPIFYDSNDTNYYLNPASSSVLNILSMAGTITGALDATASFTGGVCTAASYNYVLNGANDTGNKLVIFINGSTRTADGGVNALTIRNDGGAFVLGSASYLTSILGSSVTINGNTALTSASTLTAGNLSGTIPSGVLGNSTLYVGTTAIALNRGSASQTLTGISIDGNAATASNTTQFGSEANTNFMRGLAGGTEANINNYTDNGFRTVAYTGHGKGLLSFNVGSSIGTVQHEYFYNIPTNGWRVRNKTDSTTWSSWGNVVMTDTNQGALTGTVITTGNSSGLSPTFSNLYAAVFYDSANSAYYIDPASTSNLVGLTVANTITGSISGNAATATTSSQLGGVAAANYVRNDVDGTDSTALFRLTTITKSLTITTSWLDTGIIGANLATGCYMISVYVDNYAVSGGHYQETYTGMMSWFSTGTNSTDYDEIVLHKSGHASNGAYINLRTIRQLSGSTNLKLQIISSVSTSGASNYVFKFRRLI